ncbi:MAG: DUF1998 domain-containing protein, partial [Actinomycetota bacterium]|nr:DUF1998 domain-containing protein [Actinomycetota bacterium]
APGAQLVAGGRVWTGGGLAIAPVHRTGGEGRVWDQFGYAVCSNCLRFNEVHLSDTPPESCRHCTGSLSSGHQGLRGIYVKPEFGFIASPDEPKRSGEGRPRRIYSSRVFFADFGQGPNVDAPLDLSPDASRYRVAFSRGGRLAVVNAGPAAGGFRVCERCGHGETAPLPHQRKGRGKPASHRNPKSGRPCNAPLRSLHLGHTFETDVLAITLPASSPVDRASGLSLLYAILEGASEALGISRDDLDGVVWGAGTPELLVFDAVPGGAGHARLVGERFEDVAESARRRVASCECGLETSCYECLRAYANQPFHDFLERGLALAMIDQFLRAPSAS